jgi:cytochrome c biogenesis protein CcmG/thiol:disulfide interchange protein DsbE
MRRLLPWLAAAAVAAVLVIGLTQAGGKDAEPRDDAASPAESQKALEGAPAPLAALHEDAGELREADRGDFRKQLADLRGYPVVVNAWASWCGPCKLEFPFFRSASTRLGKEVAFLGLNVNDNRADAKRFLAKEPVPYPHLVDGDSRVIQAEAKAGGLPVTVYYDRKGKRSFVHQGGYRSESDLIADVRRYTR